MKAFVYRKFGPQDLETADLPNPEPGKGEVRIKVYCAGVNPVDWKAKDGLFDGMIPYHFPAIPGWDAAGVVERLGDGVEAFKPGDEVFVYGRVHSVGVNGTYAEYTCLPADLIAHKPKSLTWGEAAGVPLVALTAWQALVGLGKVKTGQTVIIPAAAGGVGSFMIQFARYFGAKTIATCSEANRAYVEGLGADMVFDYRKDLDQLPKGEGDFLLGSLSPDRLMDYLPALKPGATIVTLAGDEGLAEAGPENLSIKPLYVEGSGQQLGEVARLIENGAISALPVKVMPFKDANEALAISRTGHGYGKLVLEVIEGVADARHAQQIS